ncbi:uncharacterized protein LOC134800094 [Cydia splendana]|uniref:uncharacterized protein LOC134800094 n=1 Tax=Cydia splendana TaxID=1100963 RepID=UPI00212CE1F1
MYRIAVVIALLEVVGGAPSPLRVTINCGLHESDSSILHSISRSKLAQNKGTFDVNSFCDLIHNAIPKAVQDGRFIVADQDDMDQEGYGDTQSPIAIAPPKGYIPKLGLSRINRPKLRIPAIKVPRLDLALNKPIKPPVLGSPMIFKTYRDSYEEPTSAEKMEQFKKGVQKMLHFVKILGQVDQYLTERTKIVIEKLSKTFAE